MFSKRPTFASAMGHFSKAREELKKANDLNAAELYEAKLKVDECEKEKADIDRATSFLDSILDGKEKA